METLRKYVEDYIGIPLSMIIPKDIELFPLNETDPEKAYSFISKEARERIYWLQSDIGPFLQNAPIDFYLGGHLGHGSNTYALHLAHVDEWSKVFLRLPIGGIYMDDIVQAKRIREFLPKFFNFKKRIRDKAKILIVVESMWYGLYRVLFHNGTALELEETLFENPNFDLILEKGKLIDASKILL